LAGDEPDLKEKAGGTPPAFFMASRLARSAHCLVSANRSRRAAPGVGTNWSPGTATRR